MKKIMAVLFSVAMLFAFASCDNSTTSNPYFGQQVQRVVLESAPDYVVGDTINPADVQIRVVYDNGSAIISGEEAGMYSSTNSFLATASGYAEFEVNYGSDNPYLTDTPSVKDWTINVPVYAIDKIKVDATAGATTIAKGASSVSTEGLAYTIVYTKGTTEVERTATALDLTKMGIFVTASAITTSAEIDDEVAVTVAVQQYLSDSPAPVKTEVNPKDWKVSVVEDSANTIASVKIEQNTKVDVFYLDSTSTLPDSTNLADGTQTFKNNTISALPWKVTVTFGNGDTATYTGTGSADGTGSDSRLSKVSVKFVDYSKATTTLVSTRTDTFNVRITVDPTADGAENNITDTSLPFDYTDDYPTVITASTAEGKTYKAGDLIDIDDFTFYATTYASGVKYKENSHELSASELAKVVLKTTSVDWGTANTDSYSVTFEWADKDAVTTPDITGSVTVENE